MNIKENFHKPFLVLGVMFLSGYLGITLGAAIEGFLNVPQTSSGNPAAVYCTDVMGYDYYIENNPDGSQDGFCILPDNSECEQWDFYAGTCGAEYSYCVQNGYDLETRDDGQDPFSPYYASCVTKEGQLAGTTLQLSSLSELTTNPALNTDLEIPSAPEQKLEELSNVSVPSSWDWRNYNGANWLSPVRDQSSCGSCWAFAAIGITEAHHNIISSNPNLNLDLSEQELISCSSAGGCEGGSSVSALSYIQNTGVSDESCMPYTASDSACNKCSDWASRLTTIDAYHNEWYPTSRNIIKDAVVNYGPSVVYMGIGANYGGYFDGNNIYRCSNDSDINHAVVVVGYNDTGGYWIIRNSWGRSWGRENTGYFKVGYGECSIDSVLVAYIEEHAPPATPSNFHVSGSTTSSISLAWDNVRDETGYKIYKWGYDGTDWTFIYYDSVGANITTYTDSNLECEDDFNYYTVSAYNEYGESDQSSWKQGITQNCTNDDFKGAIDISTIPHTENMDTSGATQNGDDPQPSCLPNAGQATVWYKYTPSTNSAVSLDTKTSDYDTFIAVWTGTRTNLTEVVCNDDIDWANGITQSEVAFRIQAGVTYYIEVGQYLWDDTSATMQSEGKPRVDNK